MVLLVDNMQYYFNRTEGSEHFSLRGKLNRPGAPVIMATSDKVLSAFTDYNAAFFDGFKISYMRPLAMSDVQAAVPRGTDMGRLEKTCMGTRESCSPLGIRDTRRTGWQGLTMPRQGSISQVLGDLTAKI